MPRTEKLDILRLDDIWQAFAVLLPVKTGGVMGDGCTHDYVVGRRDNRDSIHWMAFRQAIPNSEWSRDWGVVEFQSREFSSEISGTNL